MCQFKIVNTDSGSEEAMEVKEACSAWSKNARRARQKAEWHVGTPRGTLRSLFHTFQLELTLVRAPESPLS